MNSVAIKDGIVQWMHPDIYGDETPRSVLRVELYHVRAADDIEIEYHSDRDGYAIYRTVTVGYTEPTPEKTIANLLKNARKWRSSLHGTRKA